MVRIDRILKDYRETGALNSLIAFGALWMTCFFQSGRGRRDIACRVDFECLDHPRRQAVAHRFEQALANSTTFASINTS